MNFGPGEHTRITGAPYLRWACAIAEVTGESTGQRKPHSHSRRPSTEGQLATHESPYYPLSKQMLAWTRRLLSKAVFSHLFFWCFLQSFSSLVASERQRICHVSIDISYNFEHLSCSSGHVSVAFPGAEQRQVYIPVPFWGTHWASSLAST